MDNATDKEISTPADSKIDLSKMTREEALAYMGLSSDADIKEIDDRFWQMSKKLRGKTDPESKMKEDEISSVYDIASGRRDRRVEEEKILEAEPKYFGKSKSEWKNYVDYTWYKYLIGLVIAVTAVVTIYGLINNSRTAYAVAVFGHMGFDDSYIRAALVEQGAKNPYIGYANVIVPNDEGLEYSETGNETLNAMFYMDPVVLVSDKQSYPYYYSTYADLSPLEDRIMAGLTDEAKAGIAPVYMSERESMEYQNEMLLTNGFDKDDVANPDDFPDEKHLIGFEITDPALAGKLGIESWWKSRETTVFIAKCSNASDDDKVVLVITTIINSAFA